MTLREVWSGRTDRLRARREELGWLARRSREDLLLAALTGAVVGLLVAAVEQVVVEEMLAWLLERSLWAMAVAPVAGLLVAGLVLRLFGPGLSPSTSDEYIQAFHDPAHPLGARRFAGRMLGGIATLGSGAALGLEGVAIYGGASVGSEVRRRLPAKLRPIDHRTLLVAGAAAGVAAVFKAPVTGAIFAIEVPFQNELARRMLLPSLVASASGYLVFVAINGTTPLFGQLGAAPDFSVRDLLGALVVGVVCAVGARAFARAVRLAKRAQASVALHYRLVAAAAILPATFWAVYHLTDRPLAIGPGYQVLEWLHEPDLALWLLLAVFALRSLAATTALAAGGVGGIFIPLVVLGAIVGRCVGAVVHPDDIALYTLLGVAAFLGAGYRVPLAAVVFVAETTGKPGFIVPALFAAVAGELVMGAKSVTPYQRSPEGVQ